MRLQARPRRQVDSVRADSLIVFSDSTMPPDSFSGPDGAWRSPLFSREGLGAEWTATRLCGFASSASLRRRATVRSSTSAGGGSAPCSRRWSILRDQVVPADRLADCVWGDHPPANPAGALQAYVSHLRRRLQPEAGARQRDGVIVSEAAGYALRLAPDAVDAWCFEEPWTPPRRLRRPTPCARSTTRSRCGAGRAYAEYAGEPWVEAEIARLTELRAVARERLLEARLQLGEAALLVSATSRPSSPRTRCARSGGGCWCSRCTAPSARPTRWRRCGGPGAPWPRSWASTRARRCGRWRPRCSRSRPPSTRRPRRSACEPSAGHGRPGPVHRPTSSTAARRRRRCGAPVDGPGAGEARLRAHRGTGRDRQDPAARRGHPAGRCGGRAGAVRPGQPAGAVLRLRGRAPALRAVPRRPAAPATPCSAAPPPARGRCSRTGRG